MPHNNKPPSKFRINTNYLLVPEDEVDIYADIPTISVSRSARRIIFWKYAPFGLHFALTLLVAATCLFFLDGRGFGTVSRRPVYPESNGSFSHQRFYSPLQSDITSAISLAATVTRVAGGWWGSGYLWRSVFVAMERGGISVEGLSRVVSNMPPTLRHFKRKSNMAIILAILSATYGIDYFSAALNGAITWEAAYYLVPGNFPVTGIARGVSHSDMQYYWGYRENRDTVMEIGTTSANLAWGTIQQTAKKLTTPATVFRRILDEASYLPTNSTLNNVTMPYFIVDNFEWIKDPDTILDDRQMNLFFGADEFNPYVSGAAMGGLLPDRQWGPPQANSLPDPHIVSEARLLAFRTERRPWDLGPCPTDYLIDPNWKINLHNDTNAQLKFYDCFAIANVTYRAGATLCQDCKIVSESVIEATGNLTIIPDSFTSMALGLAPSLGTHLIYSGYAIPQNYGTNENLVIEMVSRTYQAAWGAYSKKYGSQFDTTAVKIALPTLRAKALRWKVFVWVALHLGVLLLGLVFIYLQSHCDHPWTENPTMALFWLDVTAVSGMPQGTDSYSMELDPWRPGITFGRDGMLTLEKVN